MRNTPVCCRAVACPQKLESRNAGIRERIRLTGDYLARKEAEYDALKSEIEELKSETIRARNGRKAA